MTQATRPGPSRPAGAPSTPVPSTLLSVHGPVGVVDMTVPVEASVAEVAEAYGDHAGIAAPVIVHRGRPVDPQRTLAQWGLRSGAVVVAVSGPPPDPRDPQTAQSGRVGAGKRAHRPARERRGARDAVVDPIARAAADRATRIGWLIAAVALAVVAAWTAIVRPDGERQEVVAVLAATALLACLPLGPGAGARALAAPALAAAAVFVAIWDPVPERLPTVLGATALAGAVTAAIARAWADPADGAGEGLRVWIVTGAAWFVIAALGALVGVAAQVVWALLFLGAVLAARTVPSFAIDVPDHYLLDLERLAVNAWSARERPAGKRGRVVVPERVVADVAARGGRSIDAAAVAVLAVVTFAAPQLLLTADLPLDRVGARCLVGFGGGALLLAARGHRHPVARTCLRLAGVLCWSLLAVVLLLQVDGDPLMLVTGACVLGGFGLAALAAAVGRGWRSAWWSRRAEVAEVLCGAFAVASLVVAVGLFRWLWELTG